MIGFVEMTVRRSSESKVKLLLEHLTFLQMIKAENSKKRNRHFYEKFIARGSYKEPITYRP